MKVITRASLIVGAMLVAASAHAGNGCRSQSSYGRAISYGPHHYVQPQPHYIQPQPNYHYARQPSCAPSGYWTTREQRCFVPGRWVPQVSPYTSSRKVWQSAHYETRLVRVWVPTRG